MASLSMDRNPILSVRTSQMTVTIHGHSLPSGSSTLASPPENAVLRVRCADVCTITLGADSSAVSHNTSESSHRQEYETPPLLRPEQSYTLLLESPHSCNCSVRYNCRSLQTERAQTATDASSLSASFSTERFCPSCTLDICLNAEDYLHLTIPILSEVPSPLDSYRALVSDAARESLSVMLSYLRDNMQDFPFPDTEPATFLSTLSFVCGSLLREADSLLPPFSPQFSFHFAIRQTFGWLRRQKPSLPPEAALVRRLLCSALESLRTFRTHYAILLQSTDDPALAELDRMIQHLQNRCPCEGSSQLSLSEADFYADPAAPACQSLYQHYQLLQHCLCIASELFLIPMEDTDFLYAYWCFVKLNSILRSSDALLLLSQNLFRRLSGSNPLSFSSRRAAQTRYLNPITQTYFTLSYRPCLPCNPELPVLLTVEKPGMLPQIYAFSPKYRCNPAHPHTEYFRCVSRIPGPELSDLEALYAYCSDPSSCDDAIAAGRSIAGARLLFPSLQEDTFRDHPSFREMETGGIGAFPFLPHAVSLVTEQLERLISGSADASRQMPALPQTVEEKLLHMDWSVRDVLVGTLRNKQQLDVCLKHRFYHIPAIQLRATQTPIRYIAIYQSSATFGQESGIAYYGQVVKRTCVRRSEITEIPPRRGTEQSLYDRFEILQWKQLRKPIAVQEAGFIKGFTNLFLLEHSTQSAELWIRSGEEYRLYAALQHSLNDFSVNDQDASPAFSFRRYTFRFDNGQILLCLGAQECARYPISAFSQKPGVVFPQILQTLCQLEARQPSF